MTRDSRRRQKSKTQRERPSASTSFLADVCLQDRCYHKITRTNHNITPYTMSSPSSIPKLVLVTGANGYIGSSLIQSLLEQGYRVRSTLRDADMANEHETQVLMDMTNASTHLELLPLELEGPEDAFDKAVQGVEWIFHVAQPVSVKKIKDEQSIIGPAVTGTLNMLRAANTTPSVTKFVLTSSIAAIVSGKTNAYTEDDWADVNAPSSIAYFKSKILSEETAWKFMKENTPSFTLSVINPGLVFGPVPSRNVKSTSDIVGGVLRGGGVYNLFCCFVDVRDVVQAHIQAAKRPEAAGKRFILVQSDGGEVFLPRIGEILDKEFGPMGYEIKTTPAPKWVMWLMSWFVPEIAGLWPMIDKQRIHFDNTRSREILQLDYVPAEQTIVDGGYSLIEHGLVAKKPGYKSRKSQPD